MGVFDIQNEIHIIAYSKLIYEVTKYQDGNDIGSSHVVIITDINRDSLLTSDF